MVDHLSADERKALAARATKRRLNRQDADRWKRDLVAYRRFHQLVDELEFVASYLLAQSTTRSSLLAQSTTRLRSLTKLVVAVRGLQANNPVPMMLFEDCDLDSLAADFLMATRGIGQKDASDAVGRSDAYVAVMTAELARRETASPKCPVCSVAPTTRRPQLFTVGGAIVCWDCYFPWLTTRPPGTQSRRRRAAPVRKGRRS